MGLWCLSVDIMFMVLSSWQSHCESSPGSFIKCKLSARWKPNLKLSQMTWDKSPMAGCYHPRPSPPFIITTLPESWYSWVSQVDSAFYPPWNGKMSTSQRVVMLCSWEVKAGMVQFAAKTVWSMSERIRGSYDDALYKSTYTLFYFRRVSRHMHCSKV